MSDVAHLRGIHVDVRQIRSTLGRSALVSRSTRLLLVARGVEVRCRVGIHIESRAKSGTVLLSAAVPRIPRTVTSHEAAQPVQNIVVSPNSARIAWLLTFECLAEQLTRCQTTAIGRKKVCSAETGPDLTARWERRCSPDLIRQERGNLETDVTGEGGSIKGQAVVGIVRVELGCG